MRLAARLRPDQELDAVLPAWPGIDQPHRGEVAVADEEILGAERGAMRQIEGELGERHEALTRERSAGACPTPSRLRDTRA